jgi:hypothetical protein
MVPHKSLVSVGIEVHDVSWSAKQYTPTHRSCMLATAALAVFGQCPGSSLSRCPILDLSSCSRFACSCLRCAAEMDPANEQAVQLMQVGGG